MKRIMEKTRILNSSLIQIYLVTHLAEILTAKRILVSTSDAVNTYQEDYNEELRLRSERINQIINGLFVPFAIGVLIWCLYSIWKRKRRKQNSKKKRLLAVENLEKGMLFCLNEHPLSNQLVTVKKMYRRGIIKSNSPIYCEKCLIGYPLIKKFHRCRDICQFNICKKCFKKAEKTKNKIERRLKISSKKESKRYYARKFARKKLRMGKKKLRNIFKRKVRERLVKRIKQKFINVITLQDNMSFKSSQVSEMKSSQVSEMKSSQVSEMNSPKNVSWNTGNSQSELDISAETNRNDISLTIISSKKSTRGSFLNLGHKQRSKSIFGKLFQNKIHVNHLDIHQKSQSKRHTINIIRRDRNHNNMFFEDSNKENNKENRKSLKSEITFQENKSEQSQDKIDL